MQICITGANGFIGRQLMETLSAKGYSIRILTRQNKTIFPQNIEVVIGDLTKVDCPLNQFLNGCDVMIHCAGEIHDIEKMRLLHIDGTQRLIQASINEYSNNKRKIHWVQLSSSGAYGPPIGKAEADREVTETTVCRPANVYESTKTKSDELVIQACDNNMMTYSISKAN